MRMDSLEIESKATRECVRFMSRIVFSFSIMSLSIYASCWTRVTTWMGYGRPHRMRLYEEILSSGVRLGSMELGSIRKVLRSDFIIGRIDLDI
jgi:hypothetical protein